MNLENWIAIAAIIVTVLIFVLTYSLNKKTRSKKRYFLEKFQENKSIIKQFIKDLEHFLMINSAWKSKAFPDNEMTYLEFLKLMKSNYEKEYSDLQYKALKKKKLSELQLDDYTKKLEQQQENLNKLRMDLQHKTMKFT